MDALRFVPRLGVMSYEHSPVAEFSPTVDPLWLEELFDLLRIPSVSADPVHAGDVMRAAEWVYDFIRSAGGKADIVRGDHHPLVIGDFEASAETNGTPPTVLLYAHFDVQPPGDDELWESLPFEPQVRDGLIYARGTADDKANLYILLRAVADLFKEKKLAVNVRFLLDGDEETTGIPGVDWLRADRTPIDVSIVLDGMMKARNVPMLTVGARGSLSYKLKVKTGEHDLHSGMFGGVGLNAIHALQKVLSAVVDNPDALHVGAMKFSATQLAEWNALGDGPEQLRSAGGRPTSQTALDEFYLRVFALPSVSVQGIAGGEIALSKSIIPAEATAKVSVRLAPGQVPQRVHEAFEKLVSAACPENCDLILEPRLDEPGSITDVDSPFIRAAIASFEEVFGARPVLLPCGGTVPILSVLAERGIPVVHSGFGLPDSGFHAPNESIPVEHVGLGVAAMRQTLIECGRVSESDNRSQ